MKKTIKNSMVITGVLLIMLWMAGCGSISRMVSNNNDFGGRGNRGGGLGQGQGMFRQRTPDEMKTQLAPFVKDGTITQQQSDTVATYVYKQYEQRRATSQEERRGRQNRGGENGGQMPSQLSELVKNGTITQVQSDKVSSALFLPRTPRQQDTQ
jgi:hypothetical protein